MVTTLRAAGLGLVAQALSEEKMSKPMLMAPPAWQAHHTPFNKHSDASKPHQPYADAISAYMNHCTSHKIQSNMYMHVVLHCKHWAEGWLIPVVAGNN